MQLQIVPVIMIIFGSVGELPVVAVSAVGKLSLIVFVVAANKIVVVVLVGIGGCQRSCCVS
jgi:hypothetical protein